MPKRNAILGIACISMLVGCQPAATTTTQNFSALSPTERRLFEQASERRAAGKTGEAIELYTQAAQLSSGSVEAHVAIAEILRAANNAAQSLNMLGEALRIKSTDARLHMEKGFSLVALSKYDEAIRSFDQAITFDEELGSAYSGKAVAYDLQGQHSKAQQMYSEAKARGLGTPALDNNYALSLIFSGKHDGAIALLTPHADSSYATTTMKQNLALAYGLKGDVGRAKHYASDGLDPASAKKNLDFYKRFTALKHGNQPGQKILAIAPAAGTNQAVPSIPVEVGDVGFVTGNGRKTDQVIIKPNVEVVEIDASAFEKLVQ